MIKLLMPDIFVDSYEEVNKEMLLQRKISCLICDIDNTLAPHDVERPDEKVIKYIKSLKEAGINVFFVSNNKKARVAYFCRDLDCDYFSFCVKTIEACL